MGRFWIAIIVLAVFFLVVALAIGFYSPWKTLLNGGDELSTFENISGTQESTGQAADDKNDNQENIYFQSPLGQSAERITKKRFGQFVAPQNSPVQPERFRGYHTGTDFEIFPEELDADVPVAAICEGKIIEKRMASGYGGVLFQKCSFDNQTIAVLYGHLKLSSVSKNAGDGLAKGEKIGILGKAESVETDGERKHLHLAIRKGDKIDIRGYVQNRAELSEWIDPCSFQLVCR